MVAFIDAHRQAHGSSRSARCCRSAPSTYLRRKAEQLDPTTRWARAHRDDVLQAIIRRIRNENQQVYGPRKVWKQMGREQLHAARCRVRAVLPRPVYHGSVTRRPAAAEQSIARQT